MDQHHNVTLSLPRPLLQQFRVYAAKRNRSMTSIMTDAIRTLLDNKDETERAAQRAIERMRNAPDWGTRGKITWTRDEIHER